MPAIDLNEYAGNPATVEPARNAAAVTPDDANDLTFVTRALVVAVGGTLKVTTAGGQTVAMTVPAGILPLRVSRVWAGGTSASGITAIW